MTGTVISVAAGLVLWLFVPGWVKIKSKSERKIFRIVCMVLGIAIAVGAVISFVKTLF